MPLWTRSSPKLRRARPGAPAGGTATPRTPNNPAPPNGGGSPQTPVRPLPPLSHLPIIDFVVTFTQPAYYGSRPGRACPPPAPHYDPIDLGGTVRIPVTRKFNLFFDRITEGTLNQPLECSAVYNPASRWSSGPRAPWPRAASAPRDSRDILLQYHGTYAFDRFVSLDLGDSFRHRIFASDDGTTPQQRAVLCNNNSAQPARCTVSSTEHHFGYRGLSYTTKPVRNWWNSVFVFSETVERQNVDHHVAMVCSAGIVALDQAAARAPTATERRLLRREPEHERVLGDDPGHLVDPAGRSEARRVVPDERALGRAELLRERHFGRRTAGTPR